MNTVKHTKLSDLMLAYEAALTQCGLNFSTRLRLLLRANTIVNRHDHRNMEYLDSAVVADYVRELDDRFYNEAISKKRYEFLRREVERFLWFAETGEVKLPNLQQGSRQALTSEYEQVADGYLSEEMHPNTRNDARWVTHKYFAWLEKQGHADLSNVGSEEIQRFLLDCSAKMAINSIYDIRLHLKKLYAYLYKSGQSESSYQVLLSFKINRESKVRPIMSRSEIAKMLEGINRKTAGGKRAYAIMMLGTVLGLRACDVVNLKLNDIDWANGVIKILQQKTVRTVVLPLTKDLGEALQDYILNARPKTNVEHIFFRLCAPLEPIKSAVTIGGIFQECCKVVGIDYGRQYHILRRSLGTAMVNTGAPVTMVAQVLGHADMNSAKKYIAVDSEHLKLCALPFDGIAPIGGASL